MQWRFNGKIIGKGGKRWENPIVNGRFIAGKIIELNGVFSVFSIAMSAMCHYQRVNVMNYTMLFKVLDPPNSTQFTSFLCTGNSMCMKTWNKSKYAKRRKTYIHASEIQYTAIPGSGNLCQWRLPQTRPLLPWMLQGDAPPLMLVGLGNPIDYRY